MGLPRMKSSLDTLPIHHRTHYKEEQLISKCMRDFHNRVSVKGLPVNEKSTKTESQGQS